MLSYVALRKGDSVGLVCFADEIQRYVPPRGGMNQMNRLLHASFDRFPRNWSNRATTRRSSICNSHCRKRSLVILITNVIDEVNSNQVEQYLTSLVGRHLPLGVLLRDHSVFDAAHVRGADDARSVSRGRRQPRSSPGGAACWPIWKARACCRSTSFPSR